MQNYIQHQEKAINIYNESYSKGKDLLFHSSKMSADYRKQLDIWIEELYPMQWNKYLKHYYNENILNYSM